MEMVQQLSNALTSVSRILALHGQTTLRSSGQRATSHQTAEELNSIITEIDASFRQLQTLRTQAEAHLEALTAQPRIRPQSLFHFDPIPSSEDGGTSPSTSPESPHDMVVSIQANTGNAVNRSRAKAVAVVACSSKPTPSTFEYQCIEQCSPSQNHRPGPSGMLSVATATVRKDPQPPRSSNGARLRNNVHFDVRTSKTGSSPLNGEKSSILHHGESFRFDGDGNVVSDARESSGSNGIHSSNGGDSEDEGSINDAVDVPHTYFEIADNINGGGSKKPDPRVCARVSHHVDRVDRSNVQGGRITEEVLISTARPQQHGSVRPASSAAFTGGPRPRALRGVASGRALNSDTRSQRSHTRTVGEYKVHKPKKDPLLKRPLVVNGRVPDYV